MIPLPGDITKKDVNQWLSDGWFYYKDKSSTYQIGRLGGCSDDAEIITVHKLIDNGGVSEVVEVPREYVFAHWPECGSLNIPTQKVAVSLVRLQKKQWKRTYNSECVKLRVISDNPNHFGATANHTVVIQAAFSPEYFNYGDVLKYHFPAGWKSCAISPNVIVLKPEQGSNLTVFLNGEIIGMVADGRFTCVNPAIKRRLLPFFDYMVE